MWIRVGDIIKLIEYVLLYLGRLGKCIIVAMLFVAWMVASSLCDEFCDCVYVGGIFLREAELMVCLLYTLEPEL